MLYKIHLSFLFLNLCFLHIFTTKKIYNYNWLIVIDKCDILIIRGGK